MQRRHWILAAALFLIALALRFAFLTERPPHHDEGVNGFMVEQIMRSGYYAYDPKNYHGPAYFYLLAGARELLGFGLFELRTVTALVGSLLCLTPLLLHRRLGPPTCLAACALLATSPTLVYYARYAIHETLFVTLCVLALLCLLRFAATGHVRWIYATAAAFAGMVATKETTILFAGVVGLWLVAETIVESREARALTVLGRPLRIPLVHVVGVLAMMAAIHVTVFTGFFRDPEGVADALARSARAYLLWTDTGTGHSGHEKPWWYYLHIGARYELVLYVLAAIGLAQGFRNRETRCLGVVGFGLALVHSLIPYKMPWLPMMWLALLAIVAGRGIVVIAAALARRWTRRVYWGRIAALALVPAIAITARSSFVRPADPHEQLAYVHTSPDYNEWFGLIQKAGRTRRLRIAVKHQAMWPLPWSLRGHMLRWYSIGGNEDVIITTWSAGPAMERKVLEGAYFRAEYGIRDWTPPAFVYFRKSVFAPWLSERANDPSSGFTIVGTDAEPVGAVASRR